MQDSEKIKFVVVGAGHIGKRHAEMIRRETEAELVALADVSHTVGPKDLRESEIPLREDCAEMAELMRFGI